LLAAALELGLAAEVVAPPGIDDLLVDRVLEGPGLPAGKLGDHIWEQAVLPRYAGRRPLLSLTNTGPVAARCAALMVHDLGPLVGPHWFAPSMQLYGRLTLAAARRARVVIVPSHQIAGELQARGVDGAAIHVLREAVDPSWAPADADSVAEVRARLGIGGPFVLVVGWADPRKDTRTAALAHLLAAQRVPHTLVLAGLPHANFGSADVPAAPSMVLAGYVSDPDLRALMTGASALVYPSRYEGFGLPPLEAWACGTPAIVADTPAVREATEGLAVYVPPGDVTALAEAVGLAVTGTFKTPQPTPWTWADAAAQLLAALTPLTG
jgi:glycosyltransferase involved in cell wall biosynthesis